MLVTEFVPGIPQAERAAAIRDRGGLRRLGELLGELHALPGAAGPAARSGGAWHHLTDGGPAEEIRAMRPVVLAAWSFCLGRLSADQATRAAVNARQVAETIGPRVVAAFGTRPS